MNSLPRFAVLVFLLCTLVYANALFDGFVYDDFDLVVNNHWAREGSLLDAFHEGFWETSRGGSFYYRPVVSVSYWVGRHLWGTRPLGYHLVNLLLHAGASILLLLLAFRWLGSRSAAAAAAALFAVHPVHTQSVTWISGRTDLLATLFCLLALLLIDLGVDGARRSRAARTALVVAGLAASALALLSKEMAVTFPALLALHAAIVTRRREAGSWKRWAAPLAASLVLTAAWLALRWDVVGHAAGFADDPHAWWHPADGTASRLLAVPLIFGFYLRRLIFPLQLGFESGIAPVSSAANPVVWTTAAAGILLVFLAWRFRRRQPAVTFGVLWLLVTLLPVLNIFPIFESAMEHFAYLPSAGFLVGAVALGGVLVRSRSARVIACVVLVALMGGRTIARNADWRNERTFWEVTTRDTPSARAWNNLGLELKAEGRLDEAAEALEKVRRLRPDLPSSHVNVGVIAAAQGFRDEALRHFRDALAIDPVNADALYNMALVLETNTLGQHYGSGFPAGEAVATYKKLLAAHPEHAEGWTNLGVLYERLGRKEEARHAYEEAIRANGDLAEPRLFLADMEWASGERGRAADLYRRYLELAPHGDGADRARLRAGP